MKYPNSNMLLRIAQGDAYAACVEYVKRKNQPELYEQALKFERYLQHPTHRKLVPGMYTDDTQMSIAVAEVLIEQTNPSAHNFSDAFFKCFKRDPRDGYSRGFQTILEDAKTVDELRTRITPDSNKNGAAMRSVPLGVIKDPTTLMEVTGIQAQVTHATWGGINSSIAVALMSHYSLYDRRSLATMYDWCCGWLPAFELFKEPWVGPVSAKNDSRNLGVGMITAHAVHTLVSTKSSLLEIMKQLIEWGGDTDSVAAIAWGIASARMNETLPAFFEDDLESGSYGVKYLRSLSERLMKLNS